jgi:hypothetical protein
VPSMPKVKTSFSIVASGARELSGCDSSAEVEMQRAEGEGELMPVRSSQIPHNLERTTLQKMNATEGLLVRQLYPAGQVTLDRMLAAKDWIEKQMDAKAGAKYRITPAGEAALKAKIPDPPRRREPNKPSSG